MKKALFVMAIFLSLVMCSTALAAPKTKCIGQTVLVHASMQEFPPVGSMPYQVSVSRLFVRNVDPVNSITLEYVCFHAPKDDVNDGTCAWDYLEKAGITEKVLGPLESTSFRASPSVAPGEFPGFYPKEGGRPSFIVKWTAEAVDIYPDITAGVYNAGPVGDGSWSVITGAGHSPGIVINDGCDDLVLP